MQVSLLRLAIIPKHLPLHTRNTKMIVIKILFIYYNTQSNIIQIEIIYNKNEL